MAWFYEIRSSNNDVLKRDGGFATQDAAKTAGREDAKKMKNLRQPDKPEVDRIMVGQNTEKPGAPALDVSLNLRVPDPLVCKGPGLDATSCISQLRTPLRMRMENFRC